MLPFKRLKYSKIAWDKYSELLNGITSKNFDLLEQVCEKNILNELAASIYEKTKIENLKIEQLNPEQYVNVKVINFFRLKNCQIDWANNDSLD